MECIRGKLGWFPISRLLLKPHRTYWRLPPFQQPHLRLSSTAVPAARESPAIVLRDYQEECIKSVLDNLDQGHKRLGVSLATGAGKTVIFTQLIGRIPPRNETDTKTLILVHRRELVEQAARHCRLAYPDRTVEIEMGTSKASPAADIVVASIRSLTNGDRIAKFDPKQFKLVLVDEAHHIVAPSYREVLKYFGLNEASHDSPVLVGVSATLSRADGLKLGAAIDHIVYHKDYMDMIDEEWLANAVFTTVQSEVNLSRVKKDNFGDFAVGSLSKAVNTDRTNDITVRAWLANAQERKSTLVFCVDVEHTKQLTETFRAAGVDARYLTGKTTKEVRDDQLNRFRNQEYPVLLNCGLFTEGTDIPNIDCVLLARPTRSRNLLIQMIGRGLRLHPGKKDCHIIDMVATLETGVLSTPTLFGLHPDEVLANASGKDLKHKESDSASPANPDTSPDPDVLDDINLTFTKYDTIYDLIMDMKSEKYIRSSSRNAWVRIDENKYLLSDASGWITIEKSTDEYITSPNNNSQQPAWTVHHVKVFKNPITEKNTFTRPRLIATSPDMESAVHAADTFAASEFEDLYISALQPWRRRPATSAQLRFLNKAKIRRDELRPEHLTKGQAADLITKLRHGGKKRFEKQAGRRRKEDEKAKELEVLRTRERVRVGPVLM
ncbi:putative DEAD/DEAH box helicase [Aspergillus nomiae NRRL 13137]|uniref:Putative DEAD/DEAH box helicase n=1 Tax=Aspergillus nomiae NRRL (strain ATCC 15546 / NRRL 13137 / CBS 260.88 / M93) TaxID=1509407 RepID=A0A0L1ISI6_ASPN3|nr:putative DEAD/DEAH box helicase [Aspergillus nomiae NRRL 13137]KNG82424.1 putative DEAD/DEAH box helicase [Aspergillus nomiae NRRL 13137]